MNDNKVNPFKVPDGYFENLTSRIMDQLPDKTKAEDDKPKVISLWTRIKPWAYAAAAVVVVALSVNLFIHTQQSKHSLNLTSGAEIDEFYQYYEEQLADKMVHETLYLDEQDAYSSSIE
jgi:anti-sigma-K factor RskA